MGKKQNEGDSQADLLLKLARERYRLVCGPDGRPFAVDKGAPTVAMPLRGALGLRIALAAAYVDMTGKVPSSGPLADALAVLEADARAAAAEPVGMRVAGHDGQLVLDLADRTGRVVLLGPAGWKVVPRSPVLFRRTQLSRPLPAPDPAGGGLAVLRGLLNVDDVAWPLLLGWLVASLVPDIPHPVLAFFGEHGTAKSSAMKMALQLLNPGPAAAQAPPREMRQWSVLATNSWMVGLDNLSSIPPWLSDALCRAVTGEAIVERALYTDDDVTVQTFRRVIALTSIEAGAIAGDLADRLLPLELQRIQAYRAESEIAMDYAALWPAALADLLDLACRVLAERGKVEVTYQPRMADFAEVLAAVDHILGTKTVATYASLAIDTAEQVVEADPFAHAVRELITRFRTWQGTASELLGLITDPDKPPPRHWPTTPEGAGQRLRRATPALRAIGIDVEHQRHQRTRARLIFLSLSRVQENKLSAPAAPSEMSAGEAEPLRTGGRTAPSGDLFASDTGSDLREQCAGDQLTGADSSFGLPPDADPQFSAYGTCQGCGARGARDTTTGHCRLCTTTTEGTPAP